MFKRAASVFILAGMFSLGSSSAFAQTRMETDNKIRERVNQTYGNGFFAEDDGGVKTSDKHQLVNDENSFFTLILDFIGL